MRRFAWLGVCLLVPLAASAQTPPSFSDQTVAVGLGSPPPPGGFTIASPMLGGGIVGDFDDDGWLDLFVPGEGVIDDRLFLNDQDGTFTDHAAAWGIQDLHIGGGPAAGDYDNDGALDIFLPSFGYPWGLLLGVHRLYHNDGGSFSDRAVDAGVNQTTQFEPDGFGSAFGDMDLDGDLDLFTTGWNFGSGGNRLFENEGDGTFADVTLTNIDVDLDPVYGFMPQFIDMDGDRLPELLLSADFFTSKYLVNEGGTFTDRTVASGTGIDSNGMGHAVADFDNDLVLDWYVTSIFKDGSVEQLGNVLYRGLGDHQYEDISASAGVDDGGWGWGAVAIDMDHDGDIDIAEVNGPSFPTVEWDDEPAYVWINDGTGLSFSEEAQSIGVDYTDYGRGLLHFDPDQDGDRDMVFLAFGGQLVYYENTLDLTAADTRWLNVTLDDMGAPGVAPGGHGASVFVEAVEGVGTRVQPVTSGGGYLTQNELSAHFGLGTATSVDVVRVEWPDGTLRTLRDVAADQHLEVPCCAGWKDLGKSLAGSAGDPLLVGSGSLDGGYVVSLDLTGAVPNAPVFLILGLSELNAPFKQGVLVPSLDVLLTFSAAPDGSLFLPFVWGAGLPGGIDFVWQFWFRDPGGPAGWAASNGVRARTP